MSTKFLSDEHLENMATKLLGRYRSAFEEVCSPPIPVERILEDVLDLGILWDTVSEPLGQSILAGLDPNTKTVVFNEGRRTFISETAGLYSTVLAHEIGHWELHVDQRLLAQQPFPDFERDFNCLYRRAGPGQEPREVQAHRFMGFLMMPTDLLLEAVRDVNLLSWPILYGLRKQFDVVAPGSFAYHVPAYDTLVNPSASDIPEVSTVSASPTSTVPLMVGAPVAGVFSARVTVTV